MWLPRKKYCTYRSLPTNQQRFDQSKTSPIKSTFAVGEQGGCFIVEEDGTCSRSSHIINRKEDRC